MFKNTVLLLAVLACAVTVTANTKNPISSLPGWSGPLPVPMYSGYMTVNETLGRNLFYWLVSADIEDAPLVIWLNGGPGCSSLDGFMYEHGIFHPNEAGQLSLNPYSWNKIANMLYIDSPAGVGLSYTMTPGDDHFTDNAVADDLLEFLMQFYAMYPEFTGTDLYISGESYAGHYVPVFSERVRLANLAGANIPMKGLLVGNGITDTYYDGQNFWPFVCGHNLLSNTFCKDLATACNDVYWNVTSSTSSTTGTSQECARLMNEGFVAMGDFNIYNIYGTCFGGHTLAAATANGRYAPFELMARAGMRTYDHDAGARMEEDASDATSTSTNIVPCINSLDATLYLNTPAVRAALGAIPVTQQKWEICSNLIFEYYVPGYDSMLPFYHDFLEAGYRVLVYSGDTDARVPFTGTEAWVDALDLTVEMPWQPWYLKAQLAGYATYYSEGLTYVTVKGSGHMVPQFKPAQALEMFDLFMHNKPFNSTADSYYTSITYPTST